VPLAEKKRRGERNCVSTGGEKKKRPRLSQKHRVRTCRGGGMFSEGGSIIPEGKKMLGGSHRGKLKSG